ncbi:MAG: UDP-N-acetylglucosamine-peptide N-acetylglucosaminyltransferase, partial [Deltaproteobacteria bacterium CG_4_9_14_3_um_filter_65_9]
ENAAGFFEQALLADTGNAEAMNDLGVLCHRLGEMDLAREFLVRALAVAPESAEALSNLARLPAQA